MNSKKILLLGVLLLGIGFASVATTLYISGNVTISSNEEDFDVKFTKAVIDNEDMTNSVISQDGKTITYSTKELVKLNDTSVLDLEVTNNSGIYDAEVSIECTSGESSEYYQITKEVESIIPAKYRRPGKVEAKKIKMNMEDIEEQFTCTLNASAIERTTKGEEPTEPVCSFTSDKQTEIGDTTQVKLTCIDDKNEIENKVLTKEDFNISNENVSIVSISEGTKIEKGYEWNIGLTGTNLGTYSISLNESTIKNNINYGNNKITSDDIEVVEKTLTANFVKQGAGVTGIGATKLSCKTSNPSEGCSIKLPTITVSNGYAVVGWNEDKNVTTGLGINTNITINKDTTYYSIVKNIYNPNIVGTVPNCVLNKSANSCAAGTVIQYKVNNSTTKTFNVLHDDGATLTLQDSQGTVSSVAWGSTATSGPTTALSALESATSGWNNVNTINYTMGTTVFKTNAYTGCSLTSCTTNKYILGARSAKARMITAQEAQALGCSNAVSSCPSWLKPTASEIYWTMSAYDNSSNRYAMDISNNGHMDFNTTTNTYGARAVVVISK